MAKFFVREDMVQNNKIIVTGEDVNHIKNVLRYKIGDKIEISSGDSLEYLCEIYDIKKDEIIANIIDCFGNESEPNIKITLYQGLPKAEKMELIIQKCVELGIDSIVPINTDRTIAKLNGKEEKKLLRWNKISEASAKQSRRGKIPQIKNVMSFKEAVKEAKEYSLAVIPYEKETNNNIKKIIKNFSGKDIAIFIGAEGGFTEGEIAIAKLGGITPITLGKRILRTETAGFITTAILLYELEG